MINNLKQLGEGLEILYVEDDQNARESTTRILRRFVDNLRVAQDGKEGLDIFLERKEYLDLVITDISMPVMNGLEMLSKMKELSPSLHAIVISAHNDTGNLVDAIEIGVEHFLIKPIEPAKMFATFETVLQKIQNEKELERLKNKEINDRLWHAVDISYETLLSNIALPAIVLNEEDMILAHNDKFYNCLENIENPELVEQLEQKTLSLQTVMQEEQMLKDTLVNWKEEAVQLHEGILEKLRFHCLDDERDYGLSIQKSTLDGEQTRYIAIFF